ncbi:MAG: substrate-binding domain-containing protein [Planctomycetes bacterium]|nr:substrate-binding domain-containing protein [Planctomycetota bacterium]
MKKKPRRGRPPGTAARFKALAAAFEQKLDAGAWPVDQALPSCRQLARAHGVGVKTVWLALHALQKAGRVRLSQSRPAVATRRVPLAEVMDQTVAVVSKIALAEFVGFGLGPGVGHGIVQRLAETRHTFLFLQELRWWRQESPSGLRDLPLLGIILPGNFPPALLKKYESVGVPVVLVDQPGDEYKMHSIAAGNYDAAFDATARMLEHGHRQLAFVRSVVSNLKNIDPDAKERQAGFLAACKRAGLKSNQCRIVSATFEPRSSAIGELLQARPRVTAVLCTSQMHAGQIETEARALGLAIPRDLSVVTFRGPAESTIDWTGPALDFVAMGRAAVDLLRARPRKPTHLRMPAVWHAGETLVAPRGE